MIDVKLIRKSKKSTGFASSSGAGSSSNSLYDLEVIRRVLTPVDSELNELPWNTSMERIFALKSKFGLYSDAFISAYGLSGSSGSSGGSGGASELRMLSDVLLSNPANGQSLVYDGAKWVNKTLQIPSLSGYATEAWVSQQGFAKASDIPAIPTALKNPYSLTIQRNGSTVNTYDGSSAVTVNIADVASAATLASHIGDSSHISASERTAWNNKVDAVSGMGLSHNDFTDTLKSKLDGIEAGANKYVHPSATATTIAAASKRVLSSITVNALGHVTAVASKDLAEADIPALPISKITSLQASLDAKLDKSVFDALFEKTTVNGVTAIRAKFGLYSDAFISAYGLSGSSGSSGGSAFGLMKTWPAANPGATTTDALGANLGYDLLTRVKSLEGGSALSVSTTGTGNAITSITKSGTTITATKGSTFSVDGHTHTFASLTSKPTTLAGYGITDAASSGHTHSQYLTSHQSLANYMSFVVNANYVNASFHTSELAQKAHDTYIELWDSPGWWNLMAGKFMTPGGTSSQFLKADGSVDSNAYITSSGSCAYATSASKLQTAHSIWGQSFNGEGNVSGNMTGVGNITMSGYLNFSTGRIGANTSGLSFLNGSSAFGIYIGRLLVSDSYSDANIAKIPTNGIYTTGAIRIGDATISYDSATGMLKCDKGFYSAGAISAYGVSSTSGSSGGSAFGLMKTWPAANPGATTTDALGANLGYDLLTRVKSLEGGSALSVSTTGTGNAITSITKSGTTITATKGSTFSVDGHTHTFASLTSKPTTLAGYGITDAASSGHTHSQYLTSHQSLDYLNVKDVRNADRLTSYFDNYKASFWFNNTGMPNSEWWSGLTVKGWQDTYRTWQLAASSHNTDTSDKNLWFRVGRNGAAWEDWQKILTSTNYSSVLGSVYSAQGHTHSYLPLSGGTLKDGAATAPFNIDTDSTAESGMRFKMSGASKGWIGYNNTQGTVLYNYATGTYFGLRDNGQCYLGNNLVWHAGNDGSGSGLDADMIDGKHNGELTAKCFGCSSPVSVGVTVATAKTNLLNAVAGNVFGNVAKVTESLITNWGNDTFTTVASSQYSVVNVTPQYDGNTYGQYLMFHYGSGAPKLIGRNNSQWTSMRIFAFTDNANMKSTYGTTSNPTSGWYKIKINSTASWMLYFRVRLYQNYKYYDIDFSGYQYGSNYWYLPKARLVSSSEDSIEVKFGYDSANNLWVAVPRSTYTGMTVTDMVNGYSQVGSPDGLFSIQSLDSLTGTVQTTLTLSRSAALSEVLPITGGSLTGNLYAPSIRVNTTTSSYALNTASFICDSWVRTKGPTGWYNETYGGGWYMKGSTYIENYNSKRVKISGISDYYGIWLNGSGYCADGYAGTSWNDGHAGLNVGCTDNSNQTPLLLAYRTGAALSGANRLFSMEMLNAGTQMRVYMGGNYRFHFASNGQFYASGGIYSDGYVSAYGVSGSSDARLKHIIEPITLSLDDIADAPAYRFRWKKTGREALGSIAQHWHSVNPLLAPKHSDGYLGIDMNTALLSVISVAREVRSDKEEIRRLTAEVKALREELKTLKKSNLRSDP